MEKIEITVLVRQKLRDLLEVLITEDYFSYIENADAYVDHLIDFIYTIPTQRRYATRRKRYGHGTAATNLTGIPPGSLRLIRMKPFG